MSISSTSQMPLAFNHISVDCVVMGWDGEKLNVLLVSRHTEGEEYNDLKLPGSLIYQDEDLDEAASRVLSELTGIENAGLIQSKTYGSRDRTRDPRDIIWLERAQKAHVERIVTIAYIAWMRIDRSVKSCLEGHNASWIPVDNVGKLAFDHNLILRDAILKLRSMATKDISILFRLLPRKFTLADFRRLFEVVFDKKTDVRNFHKKISAMPYVVPLEEYQQGVAHRSARFFRFDRKIYNRHHS